MSEATQVCRRCGSTSRLGTRYCEFCGAFLLSGATRTVPLWSVLVAIVLLAVAVGFGALGACLVLLAGGLTRGDGGAVTGLVMMVLAIGACLLAALLLRPRPVARQEAE